MSPRKKSEPPVSGPAKIGEPAITVRYDVSLLTDDDIYLFNEGTHCHLYEKLGAHTMEADGVQGTYFAVWAPNAREVRVIGDFDADAYTDFADYCILAEHWLAADGSFWCSQGCDLTNDGSVNWQDLMVFADSWLTGIAP